MVLPPFCRRVVQTLLPFFLLQLVYDKEKKLRTMMKLHGLGDTAYWLALYLCFRFYMMRVI